MEEISLIKEKSQSKLRWLVLFLNCIMMMGCYYAGDIPAALYQPLKDWMGAPSNYDTLFSLLYTVYSIPNVILPFFGGFFVDKLGVKICLITFATLVTLGQVIFSVGVSAKSWPVMLLGRVLFGCGAESLGVGQGATLSQWFKGKEVAFAFGVSLSVARLGSVINNFITPSLAISVSISFSAWFGSILCGLSLLSAFSIGLVSKAFESQLAKNKAGGLLGDDIDGEQHKKNAQRSESRDSQGNKKEAPVKLTDAFKFSLPFWVVTLSCVIVYGCVLPFNNVASALLLERNYFIENPSGCNLVNQTLCQSSDNQPDYSGSCNRDSSYLKYQPPLPQYVQIGDTLYSPLTPEDIDCTSKDWKDEGTCTYDYCKDQADGIKDAATTMSIPYIISACLSPFLGAFVDKFGLRAVVATVAPLVLVIVHSFLGLTRIDPIGPLVGQGLAYSAFAAVLWPSVPLVCEQRFIGLGYGVVTSVQNMGLALFPVIIAALYRSNDNAYIPDAENFFVALAVAGVVIGLYLNYYDYYYYGNVFNLPTSKVKGGVYAPLPDGDDESGESRNSGGQQTKHRGASADALRDSDGEIVVSYNDSQNPMQSGAKVAYKK